MACTGIGPYTWYLYDENWVFIDCVDNDSASYSFTGITGTGVYNVTVVHNGLSGTTQFTITGNETCCWSSNLYQPCNESCQLTVNQDNGAVDIFFKKLNDALGFNTTANLSSRPYDVSILYSSDDNKGSNVYFQSLLRSYECCNAEPGTEILFTSPCINEPVYKVLQFCNTCDYELGVSGYSINDPCFLACPDGYTADPDGTTCVKYEYSAVTISSTIYTAYTGSKQTAYSFRTRFYKSQLTHATPFVMTGASDSIYDDNATEIGYDTVVSSGTLWANASTLTDGRLNNCGVWTTLGAPDPNPPIGEWIGFTYCVDLPVKDTYCIGLAADNKSRFYLDGELFFDSSQIYSSSNKDLIYWKVFERKLTSGKHIIVMEGLNVGAEASFGAEIYHSTIATLSAMTTYSELSAVTVFTTADFRSDVVGNPVTVFDTGDSSGYYCPDGYNLDYCSPMAPICTTISRVPQNADTNCVDNWDIRFLRYSGNCETRELIEFNPNDDVVKFSGDCDSSIYPYSECKCFYAAIGYRGDDINDRYANFDIFLEDTSLHTLTTLSYDLHGRAAITYPTTSPNISLFNSLNAAFNSIQTSLGGTSLLQTEIESDCPIKPSCDCLVITSNSNTNDNNGYPINNGGILYYEFEKTYTIKNLCYTEFDLSYDFVLPTYSGLTIDASDFTKTLGKNETATLSLSYSSPNNNNVVGIIGYSAATYDPFICVNPDISCPGYLTFDFTALPVPLIFSNTPYNFGLIGDGCCGSSTFTVQNTGTSPITITNITLSNNSFSVSSPEIPLSAYIILAAGATNDIIIDFCPSGCTDGTTYTSDIILTTIEYGDVSGSTLSSGFSISGTCVNPPISASTDSLVFIKMVDEQQTSGLTICNRTSVDQTVDMSNCIMFVSGNTVDVIDPLNYGFEIFVSTEETIENTVTYPRELPIPANECLDLTILYDLIEPNKTFCSIYLRDDCGNVTEIPFTGYSLPYPIEITEALYTNPVCYGNSNGTATFSFSGGAQPYTYIFSGDSTYETGTIFNNTVTFNNLPASETGTDYIFSLSGNPCDGSVDIPDLSPFITLTSPEVVLSSPVITTLIQPTYFEATETAYTGLTCASAAAVSITVTGGTTPYLFSWSTGLSQTGNTTPYTATLDNISDKTYSVTVYDFNGCELSTSITVPSLLPITLTIQTTAVSCYGGYDGSATVFLEEAFDPVTYIWSGYTYDGYYVAPTHTDTFSATTAYGLTAGTYLVTYQDNNSCSGYTIFDIFQPYPLNFLFSSTNVTCPYLTDGIVTFNTITGGTYPYNLYVSGETAIYSATSTTSVTDIDAGYYNVYVVDNNGCETPYQNVLITKPDPFGILYEYTATTCYNSTDGQILLTVSGGTAPYSYLWTPSVGSTNYLTGLSRGNYNVTITDSKGCLISTGYTLPYTSSYCGDIVVLDNGTSVAEVDGYFPITMNHTCLNSYSEKFISLCQNSPCTFNIISYSGISTAMDDFYLSTSLDSFSISSSGCTNVGIIFNPTSAQTYNKIFSITTEYCTHYFSLSGTGVENIISADTQSIDFGSVCFGTGETKYVNVLNLTPNETPIYVQTVPSDFSSVNIFILSGNSTATIPYTFTPSYPITNPIIWSKEYTGTTVLSDCPTLSIQLSGTGYGGNLYVSDLNFGCVNKNCYSDQIGTIYNYHCLPVTISAITIPSYYSNDLSVIGFSPVEIPAGGSTTFMVRYSALTSLSTYLNVTTSFALAGTITSGITACCVDTLNNIPYVNSLTTVPGIPTTTTVDLTNITSTNLFVSANITDSVGATPTNVTVSPALIPIPAPTLPVTAITNSFTITFNDINPVSGWFNLNLTDNCGNHQTFPFYVSSSFIGYSDLNMSNPLCYGEDNGYISIVPTGGTSPYVVIWDNGVTGTTINNLTGGTYNVDIYDYDENVGSFGFNITDPDILGITHDIPSNGSYNIFIYSANTGYVDITVTGGTTPYLYDWSGTTYLGTTFTSNNEDITNLIAGDYMVLVTDANGCQISDFVSLIQPQPITIVINNCTPPMPPAVSCTITGGTAEMSVSGGQCPYSVVVCPTSPQNPLFDVGGPYYGYTTCQTLPDCSVAPYGSVCVSSTCYCCDDSLYPCLSASCPCSYCDITIDNLPEGNYPPGSFTIVDANSGSTSYNVPSFIPNPSTLGFRLSQTPTTCAGTSNGTITATVIPTMNELGQYGMGVPPYTYYLDGVQQSPATMNITKTFTGLTSAYHTIVIEDSDFNAVSQEIYVTQNKLLALISTTSETLQQVDGTIIIGSILGGIGPFTAKINSSDPVVVYDGFIFTNLSSGSYLIEITDSLGCYYAAKPVVNRIVPQANEGQKTTQNKISVSNQTIYEKRLGGFKLTKKK